MRAMRFLLALLLAGLAVKAAATSSLAQALSPEALALQAVERLSYGPTPGEVERVRAMGAQAYIDQQMSPQSLPEPPALTERLAALPTVSMDTVQLFRTYGPKGPGGPRARATDEEIKAAREKAMVIGREAAEAKLWRALLSPRQLEERLCEFWYNHFNIPASKGLTHLWVGSFEREAIRPYVFGRFEDMLVAVTRHPAMLIHLENWQSASPDSQTGKGAQRPLVDLHARELLTSHTMGQDVRLKAQDVNALALMLAGWSIGAPRSSQDVNGFVFDERRHDMKDKTFLGQTIKGSGVGEGLEALRLLAAHPDTARNVSAKLARFFVGEDVPKPMIDALAKVYLDTGGDLKAVLKSLFASPEFAGQKYAGNKFKSPLRYLTGIVRAAGRPVTEVRSLAEHLEWLAMPLYDAPGVSGYKDGRDAWLGAGDLLKRLNLAIEASQGALPCWASSTYAPPFPLDAQALAKTMGVAVSPNTSQAMESAKPEFKAAVLLGAPEGQYY